MENLEVFVWGGSGSSITSFASGQPELHHLMASRFFEQNLDFEGLYSPCFSPNPTIESVFCSLDHCETSFHQHPSSPNCASMSDYPRTNPSFPISQIPENNYFYDTFVPASPDIVNTRQANYAKRTIDRWNQEANGKKKMKLFETLSSSGHSSGDDSPEMPIAMKSEASRGTAVAPQSLFARRRRARINERLRILQSLVPNGAKVDLSTMLEEAVRYVKFLQLQIKLLSSDDLWMYAPLAYDDAVGEGFHNRILFSAFRN